MAVYRLPFVVLSVYKMCQDSKPCLTSAQYEIR